MVDNLQAAIDGRLKAASLHAAQGTNFEKHLYIIVVLERLQGLFCGECMPSVPPPSPPSAALIMFSNPNCRPPMPYQHQFQKQQQYPEHYPSVTEYSPYYNQPAPLLLEPTCYATARDDTFHHFRNTPASALCNPDTYNLRAGFPRDGDFRAQMPECSNYNDPDNTWNLDQVHSPPLVNVNTFREPPPSPALSSASMSSYDEDFPPLLFAA